MTTNTEPTTRELVYLAGLLRDKRLRAASGYWDLLLKSTLESSNDWVEPLLLVAEAYASGGSSAVAQTEGSAKLQSIFPNLHESDERVTPYFFPHDAVSLNASFFPKQIPAQADKKEVDSRWNALASAIQKLNGQSVGLAADSLLNILESQAATMRWSGLSAHRLA